MTEHTQRSFPQVFAGLTVMSIALVLAAWFGAQSLTSLKNADNTIRVTGSARESIRADLGVWRSNVSVTGSTRQIAYENLQQDTEQVRRYFLTEKNVPEDAFSLQNTNTRTLYEQLPNGRNSNQIRGFVMTQNFEVSLPDVDRIQALSRASQELLTRNLNFESTPPEFLYTKLGDLRVKMLSQASQDARNRAAKIVESVGNTLGPVRSVRTGVFQITRPHSTEVSDYGMYDTRTIEKDITAVLTMSFAVK